MNRARVKRYRGLVGVSFEFGLLATVAIVVLYLFHGQTIS